jgi:nuclear transport factor 2 (NTF2) superfamily protein
MFIEVDGVLMEDDVAHYYYLSRELMDKTIHIVCFKVIKDFMYNDGNTDKVEISLNNGKGIVKVTNMTLVQARESWKKFLEDKWIREHEYKIKK